MEKFWLCPWQTLSSSGETSNDATKLVCYSWNQVKWLSCRFIWWTISTSVSTSRGKSLCWPATWRPSLKAQSAPARLDALPIWLWMTPAQFPLLSLTKPTQVAFPGLFTAPSVFNFNLPVEGGDHPTLTWLWTLQPAFWDFVKKFYVLSILFVMSCCLAFVWELPQP